MSVVSVVPSSGPEALVQPYVDRHMAALSGPDGVCCDHINEGEGVTAFAFARLPGLIVCFGCMPLLRERAGTPVNCDGCGTPGVCGRPLASVMALAGLTALQIWLCPACRKDGTDG